MRRAITAILPALLLGACAGGPPVPVDIDTRNDTCSWCRMAVSERPFAAQVVAPAEVPKFFDDIGCLRDWLAGGAKTPIGAAAWVTDHRTLAWVPAGDAVYANVPGLATPMASGLAAWADDASRLSDPQSQGGEPRTIAQVFGAFPPPGSPR